MISSYRDSGCNGPQGIKYLGVTIDPHLTWSIHVDTLCKKISSDVFLIRSLKQQVPDDALLMAYHSIFMSKCTYGLLVWGHSSHMARVFGMQRRVVRVLANLGYRDAVRDKFVDLKLLTLPSIYILHSLLFIADNLCQYTTNSGVHNHLTRAACDIRTPFLRLEHSRNAENYYGPIFYNKLPNHIKGLGKNLFKRELKNVLLNNAFYSIKEFLDFDFKNV